MNTTMSYAERRARWIFGISVPTVLIGIGASVFVWANQIDVFHDVLCKGLGAPTVIPLIAIVVLSRLFPEREDDERDIRIDRKAQGWGMIGGMSFLFGLSVVLCLLDPLGSIRTVTVPFLAVLTYFAYLAFASGVALHLYGPPEKGDCDV